MLDPKKNCQLCPRLADFRSDNKKKFPEYFNAPAPSFGDENASLLIVGLAPGLHGANQTGRPFTGDYAGDLLYSTLKKFGFSTGTYDARPDDGVMLKNAMITNAVRCVPPQNKPIGAEIKACRPFLVNTIDALTNLKAILNLGRIAHDSTLTTLGIRKADAPFAHGAAHQFNDHSFAVFDSYHCSRYNTNTGRLTTEMFEAVFEKIRTHVRTGLKKT